MLSTYLQVKASLSWYISLCYEKTPCNFHCLANIVKLLCYMTIHKLLCYNKVAKSFECCLLNLVQSVLLLIPRLVLLIVSLKNLTCLQLILVWFKMDVVWLLVLRNMFKANLHLQTHEYPSSLALLYQNWLFLVCLLLLVVFFSHFFMIQSDRVSFYEILESQISWQMILSIMVVRENISKGSYTYASFCRSIHLISFLISDSISTANKSLPFFHDRPRIFNSFTLTTNCCFSKILSVSFTITFLSKLECWDATYEV